MIKISTSSLSGLLKAKIAVVVQDGPGLTCPSLAGTDAGRSIERAMAAASFGGMSGDVLAIPAPTGTDLDMLIIVGAGGAQTPLDFRKIGASIALLPQVLKTGEIALFAAASGLDVLRGMALRAYSFDLYRTAPPVLRSVTICGADLEAAALSALEAEVSAIHFARDLINEPANVLSPLEMATRIARAGEAVGIAVEILDEGHLKALGCGLHLGVGQGSDNPPCAVVMHLGPGEKPPVALVGKGITFDTGGIHLKDVHGMWEMKGDMAGAATAAATMIALAKTGYAGDAVAVLGLAENMISGNATRPGDILTSYSGKTVEVRDPDCEGRLVLADCLSYAQRALGAKTVIDIATLTYAVQIGLGTRYAGLYGNAPDLRDSVIHAAGQASEKIWPMPIDDEFHAELKSDFADMVNWPGVKYGNASIASAFLENFIDEGTDWAHIDIAGPSYVGAGTAFSPPGGSGVIIETLIGLLRDLA
ncbi:M17 family peptidase N-terminal domain-containing protein [Martelella sp. HB161492]|uniref:leucyl aminopeptidase family protein n=1 Tax=Martelella sp. HB161492 TaxID=2720726 RepID=UPI0015925C43|nr:M17 family peptidase N-terminal domain-containing protein [Martelella sp. HB161492]